MSAETTLAHLRRFLLSIAGVLFVGTLVELWFTNHMEEPAQWIPFGLCGVGLAAAGAMLAWPRRAVRLGLRVSMIVVGLGSAFGIYEHIANNVAFQLEIHPSAALPELVAAGLGGANPLLAPGILGLAALLALAATYQAAALTPPAP
jgi:hypothetical protein